MKFQNQWNIFSKSKGYISLSNISKKGLLKMISFYQYGISPFLGPNCRYTPTCSQYTYEAILEHGAIKGTYLGIRRILRCNPFHKGGYDPVPCKKDDNKNA